MLAVFGTDFEIKNAAKAPDSEYIYFKKTIIYSYSGLTMVPVSGDHTIILSYLKEQDNGNLWFAQVAEKPLGINVYCFII